VEGGSTGVDAIAAGALAGAVALAAFPGPKPMKPERLAGDACAADRAAGGAAVGVTVGVARDAVGADGAVRPGDTRADENPLLNERDPVEPLGLAETELSESAMSSIKKSGFTRSI
jgi:hypothetical protein